MNCDAIETLIQLRLDGALDPAGARALDAHLAGCPACRRSAAAFADLERALRAHLVPVGAPPFVPPPLPAAGGSALIAKIAAGVAATLLLAPFAWRLLATAPAPAAKPPAPPAAESSRPSIPPADSPAALEAPPVSRPNPRRPERPAPVLPPSSRPSAAPAVSLVPEETAPSSPSSPSAPAATTPVDVKPASLDDLLKDEAGRQTF